MKTNLLVIAFVSFFLLQLAAPTFSRNHTREHNKHLCDKYCHTDCKSIPDEHHKEQCEYVHSHDSDCTCHFGGHALGIFIAIGLAAVLILMCCVCRHCKKHKKGSSSTTNLVVVAQPDTVTTISQPGSGLQSYTNHSQNQQVYSVEMTPVMQSNHHRNHTKSTPTDASAVTIITSTKLHQAEMQDPFPSPPSQRVYFEQTPSSKVDANDSMFSPPAY